MQIITLLSLEVVTDCIIIMHWLLEVARKHYIILLAMLSWCRLKFIPSWPKHYCKVIEERTELYRYLITLFAILHVCISVSVLKCIICVFEWIYVCVSHIICVCMCVCVCAHVRVYLYMCVCVYVCTRARICMCTLYIATVSHIISTV